MKRMDILQEDIDSDQSKVTDVLKQNQTANRVYELGTLVDEHVHG